MRGADIFCMPSMYEGFPISLGEAMSIGLPVIGIKECLAVNDLIKDKETGLLCHNNPEDIANKLKMLMSNVELRIKLGTAAHSEMKQYDSNEVWDKWDKLIKSLK